MTLDFCKTLPIPSSLMIGMHSSRTLLGFRNMSFPVPPSLMNDRILVLKFAKLTWGRLFHIFQKLLVGMGGFYTHLLISISMVF